MLVQYKIQFLTRSLSTLQTSIADLVATPGLVENGRLGSLKALRCLRGLRPLRMSSRWEGIKVCLICLKLMQLVVLFCNCLHWNEMWSVTSAKLYPWCSLSDHYSTWDYTKTNGSTCTVMYMYVEKTAPKLLMFCNGRRLYALAGKWPWPFHRFTFQWLSSPCISGCSKRFATLITCCGKCASIKLCCLPHILCSGCKHVRG